MKPHEHALISLGYAGVVALLAGHGLTDPWLYLAAVAGGETIDIIDHPLYHLFYKRNEPHVVSVRELVKQGKWKETISYLYDLEDKRKIVGLMLHNVYSLTIMATIAIVVSLFMAAQIYPLVFFGAFLLHMLTDVVGDFRVLGHFNNWLWVLSEKVLDRIGRMGISLIFFVLLWGAYVQLGFFLISIRWGWQLASPPAQNGLLADPKLINWTTFSYIPLLTLSAYFLMILSLSVAQAHKYKLELNKQQAVPFSIGGYKYLWGFIRGKIKRTRANLEKVLLYMQAEAAGWALTLAAMIAGTLLTISLIAGKPSSWALEGRIFFLLIPVFFALFFGTFIHTTVGEVGGVLGVLLAWLTNILLGSIGLMEQWDIQFGYYLFFAAIGAWLLGLLGGIVLKGQSRMSLVAFSIEITLRGKDPDSRWKQEAIQMVRDSLQQGYAAAHNKLYGKSGNKEYVDQPVVDVVFTPYQAGPVLGDDHYHLEAVDSYVPALREMAYILCDNRLTANSISKADLGILPVMPRQRLLAAKDDPVDIVWDGSAYNWLSTKRTVALESTCYPKESREENKYWALKKNWGEIIDNTLTRSSKIQTHIVIFSESSGANTLVVSGVTREVTSTKEYATVEAEVYVGAFVRHLRAQASQNPRLKIGHETAARIFYPRISFLDLELSNWARDMAIMPPDAGNFTRHDLARIQKSLDALPARNLLHSVTANYKNKTLVLLVQYIIAILIGFTNLDPIFTNIVAEILDMITK